MYMGWNITITTLEGLSSFMFECAENYGSDDLKPKQKQLSHCGRLLQPDAFYLNIQKYTKCIHGACCVLNGFYWYFLKELVQPNREDKYIGRH